MDPHASELIRELTAQAGQRGFSLLGKLRELRKNPALWNVSPELYAWFAHQLVRSGSLTTALNLVRCGKRLFQANIACGFRRSSPSLAAAISTKPKSACKKSKKRFRVLLATNAEFASDVLCQWGRVYQGHCSEKLGRSEKRCWPATPPTASPAPPPARRSGIIRWSAMRSCGMSRRNSPMPSGWPNCRFAWRRPALTTTPMRPVGGARRICLAHLILGNETEARQFYFEASRTFRFHRGDFGSLSSLNRDLRFLRGRFSSLENQTVLAFAGTPGRSAPLARRQTAPISRGRRQAARPGR